MNSKTKGQITEAAVMLALLKQGKTILTPYGENQIYDFVIHENEKFLTVQCKTGRFKNGCVEFNLYSIIRNVETKKYKRVKYADRINFYGVYCKELDKCYLVPVADVATCVGYLRVDNRMTAGGSKSRWAKDYEI